MQLTARRGDFTPYFINHTLYNFVSAATDTVLDIGCGENNLKLFFPDKIHGVDRTLEADTFAYITDNEFINLPTYNYGIAVNSLHWGDIHKNIKTATAKCKKIWISLNENQPIDEWKSVDTWKQYGNVEYFWHGQQESTKQDIESFLLQDDLYLYLQKTTGRELKNDVETVYNTTVCRDPYFGVVRAILSSH